MRRAYKWDPKDIIVAPVTLTLGFIGIPLHKMTYGRGEGLYSVTQSEWRDGHYLSSILSAPYETVSIPFYWMSRKIRRPRDIDRAEPENNTLHGNFT